jgi:hypothetical protein
VEIDVDTIREPGGGKATLKKIPNVIEKIEQLMEYEIRSNRPHSRFRHSRFWG